MRARVGCWWRSAWILVAWRVHGHGMVEEGEEAHVDSDDGWLRPWRWSTALELLARLAGDGDDGEAAVDGSGARLWSWRGICKLGREEKKKGLDLG